MVDWSFRSAETGGNVRQIGQIFKHHLRASHHWDTTHMTRLLMTQYCTDLSRRAPHRAKPVTQKCRARSMYVRSMHRASTGPQHSAQCNGTRAAGRHCTWRRGQRRRESGTARQWPSHAREGTKAAACRQDAKEHGTCERLDAHDASTRVTRACTEAAATTAPLPDEALHG